MPVLLWQLGLPLSEATCYQFRVMAQLLLFPDPRPLVDRLGREFFRQLPERPGVYLMRDVGEVVLYVGKARNLRQRLKAYRVANPDRLPRRHLRLLRAVTRIEIQECPDEEAAIVREAELLRTLKPGFNRAGTWPAKPRFLVWRCIDERIELSVAETPESGWRAFGPLGSSITMLRAVLVRLLWCVMYPEHGMAGLPSGWIHGRVGDRTVISCGSKTDEIIVVVEQLLSGRSAAFSGWIWSRMVEAMCPFDKAALEADVEWLTDFFRAPSRSHRAKILDSGRENGLPNLDSLPSLGRCSLNSH